MIMLQHPHLGMCFSLLILTIISCILKDTRAIYPPEFSYAPPPSMGSDDYEYDFPDYPSADSPNADSFSYKSPHNEAYNAVDPPEESSLTEAPLSAKSPVEVLETFDGSPTFFQLHHGAEVVDDDLVQQEDHTKKGRGVVVGVLVVCSVVGLGGFIYARRKKQEKIMTFNYESLSKNKRYDAL